MEFNNLTDAERLNVYVFIDEYNKAMLEKNTAKMRLLIKDIRNEDNEKVNAVILSFFGNQTDKEIYNSLKRMFEFNLTEEELEPLVDFLNKSQAEILSEAQTKLLTSIVSENILKDDKLFSEEFSNMKYSDLKEAIGWVAGVINTKDFDKSNILSFDSENNLNKRQTLKNLLTVINQNSLTEKMPFKIKLKQEERIFSSVIKIFYDVTKNGLLSKNKTLSTGEIVRALVQSKVIDPSYNQIEENRKKIQSIVSEIKTTPKHIIEKKMNNILQSKFFPAGSGEVDVLLFDGSKVTGMSITTDHNTYIEQNQFFRHYLKTLIMAITIEKNKSQEEIKPIEARRILNNFKIKIEKNSGVTEKKISECNFFELLKYYRKLKGYEHSSSYEITKQEMNDIISDGKKHANFIFFGEVDRNMPLELREDVASFLMFSYIKNLTAIGNTKIDILSAFDFLKESVVARFNDVDNSKDFFKNGIQRIVEFLTVYPDDSKYKIDGKLVNIHEKYSERFCHKTDRENLINAVDTFISVIHEINKNNPKYFKQNLRKLLVDEFQVPAGQFYNLYEQIETGKLEFYTRSKINKIRKSESEHAKSYDELMINIERFLLSYKIDKSPEKSNEINTVNNNDIKDQLLKDMLYMNLKDVYNDISEIKIKETIKRIYDFNKDKIDSGELNAISILEKIKDSLSRSRYTSSAGEVKRKNFNNKK